MSRPHPVLVALRTRNVICEICNADVQWENFESVVDLTVKVRSN